ncbi:MAG: hypothetical protein ABR526_03090 [Chthoniobacterales bacterium]
MDDNLGQDADDAPVPIIPMNAPSLPAAGSSPGRKNKGCLTALLITIAVVGALIIIVYGVALIAFVASPSEATVSGSSKARAPKLQASATPSATSVTGPTGITADASDNYSKRLKGLSVENAEEYGRLSAHAFAKLMRQNALSGLESLNAMKRSKGDRELTRADIEQTNWAAQLVPADRAKIAEEAAKAGIPVEARNAFFDGWSHGFYEVQENRGQ